MSMTPSSGGGGVKFSIPKPGLHDAILYGIVHLGTQESVWKGKVSEKKKMFWMWELPRSIFTHPETGVNLPHVVREKYTDTDDSRGAVWRIVNGWRGGVTLTDDERKKFNFGILLGRHCTLQLEHAPKADGSGDFWVNVVGCTPPSEECRVLKLTNEIQKYWMPSMGLNVPENIYSWVVDIIQESKEYKEQNTGQQGYDPIRGVNHDNIEPPQEPPGGIDPDDMAAIEDLKQEGPPPPTDDDAPEF